MLQSALRGNKKAWKAMYVDSTLVLPSSSALLAATLMCAGVSKSGSPALKLHASIPSALIALAFAAIANVIEGGT